MKSFLLFAAVLVLGVNALYGDGAIPGLATPPPTPTPAPQQPQISSMQAAWDQSMAKAIKEFPAMADKNSALYQAASKLNLAARANPNHPLYNTVYDDPDAPYKFTVAAAKSLATPDNSLPAPTQQPSLVVGQYIVALNDDTGVRSNRKGWKVDAGEIYKFSGFTEDGLLVAVIGPALINAPRSNFVVVPEKDIAQAAMKYSEEVKECQNCDDSSAPEPQPQYGTATVRRAITIAGVELKPGDIVAFAAPPTRGNFYNDVVIDGKSVRFPMEYLIINDGSISDPTKNKNVVYCRAGNWDERGGEWRDPRGGAYNSSYRFNPSFTGPLRLHHRAIENDVEQAICQRDSAIASGQMDEATADSQFSAWLSNKREQEALAASTNDMNHKIDDANRKLDEQKRKVEEMQRRLHMNNF